MNNYKFFEIYTKPIIDLYREYKTDIDDDTISIKNDMEEFFEENQSLGNKEFRSKVIDKYGAEVAMVRPIVDSEKLMKIKWYLQFFYILSIISIILGIIVGFVLLSKA